MKDKEEVYQFIVSKKWPLISFIAGILIPFALSPLISPFVTELYVDAGIDSSRPNVTAHGAYVPTPSKPSTFTNLDWNESYRYYQFVISNEGDEQANNVEMNLNFPGCVLEYEKSRAPVSTAIISKGPAHGVTTSGLNRSNDILECSKEVFIPKLPSNEHVIVDFVIQQNFRALENKTTVNLNPSKNFSLKYEWEKGSVDFNDKMNGEITGPNTDKIFARAFFNYGVQEMKAGLLRSSVEYFNKSLGTGHVLSKARLKKAEALYDLSLEENKPSYASSSLEELNRLIESTNSSKAWYNKGIIYIGYSDYYSSINMTLAEKYEDNARKSFETALKKNSSYEEARTALNRLQS